MGVSNDARGWIMTAISGVACVLGASIICADIFVRRLPRMHDFRIQDSDAFLSASLSLSFGVMLFSSLYKMLPSAKRSLQDGGMEPKTASWVLIACFIGGAVGIQLLSRVLHHYIPSHIVDCEHSHDEESAKTHEHDGHQHEQHGRLKLPSRRPTRKSRGWPANEHLVAKAASRSDTALVDGTHEDGKAPRPVRPTLNARLSRTLSKLTTIPSDGCNCDSSGLCKGYTEPCGQECFKKVQSRSSHTLLSPSKTRASMFGSSSNDLRTTESTPLLTQSDHEHAHAHTLLVNEESAIDESSGHSDATLTPYDHAVQQRHKTSSPIEELQSPSQHHHHVPTNAFLSIGLQTSIAIALHKLPEGFITYATNHANPRLGFSVFLALFIHNITEGFAMALPLYLAIQSRWRAMFWSSLLGGFSQPLGAGIAALWFKLAGAGDLAPGEGVYGAMFAVTSGIMTSVALQLFSESLDLTHNRDLCMWFAFVGMGIMGVSSALTA